MAGGGRGQCRRASAEGRGGGGASVNARRSSRPRGDSRERDIKLDYGSKRESNH